MSEDFQTTSQVAKADSQVGLQKLNPDQYNTADESDLKLQVRRRDVGSDVPQGLVVYS